MVSQFVRHGRRRAWTRPNSPIIAGSLSNAFEAFESGRAVPNAEEADAISLATGVPAEIFIE